MTAEQMVGLAITLLVMLIGFIGSIVPGIPGAPLVLIAAIGHRLYFRSDSIDNVSLVALVLMTLFSFFFDYLASVYGAKRMGATWRGMAGALAGGIVGLFFGLPGILVGPFLGALLFELLGGYQLKKASQAGLGATIGLLAGAVGKCAICVMMIGLFTVSVVYRSIH